MNDIITRYMGETLNQYIQEEGRTEFDYYYNYLIMTDYIPNKLIESEFLNIECDDYTEAINARQYARIKINEILEA